MRTLVCCSVVVSLVLAGAASRELLAQEGKSQSQVTTPSSSAPRLVSPVLPVYPQIAQAARIEGFVRLGMSINLEGRVVQMRVLRSVPLLDQAAIDAVRQWRFERPSEDSANVTVTVNFRFNDPFRYPRPATYRQPLSSWIPKNFAFVYKYECRQTTVEMDSIARLVTDTRGRPPKTRSFAFGFEGEQAADVYVALVEAGVFASGQTGRTTWREVAPVELGIEQVDDQIMMTVPAELPVIDVQNIQINRRHIQWVGGDRPARSFFHTLKVRRDDSWTEVNWTEPLNALSAEREQTLSTAGKRLRALVRKNLTDAKMRPACL